MTPRAGLLLALALVGCDAGATAVVDLRTDLAPGLEFDAVEVDVSAEGGAALGELRASADTALDYGAGVRLGEVPVEPGTLDLSARLLRDGAVVAQRPLVVDAPDAAFAVTLLITRSCRAVTCSEPGQACAGGECVEATCTPESTASCPTACASDADCAAQDCATPVCVAGQCLAVPQSGACEVEERCLPSSGCATVRLGGFGDVLTVSALPEGADDPSVTADGLELVFNQQRHLWVSRRSAIGMPWGEPAELSELADPVVRETNPVISPDGLTLVFARGDGLPYDLMMSTRPSRTAPWDAPVPIAAANTTGDERPYDISPDGLTLLYGPDIGSRVLAIERAAPDAVFDTPATFAAFDPPVAAMGAVQLFDGGLRAIFTVGPNATQDLFEATRSTVDEPFGAPVALDALNSGVQDTDPWVSEDGAHLFFSSRRLGGSLVIFEAFRE